MKNEKPVSRLRIICKVFIYINATVFCVIGLILLICMVYISNNQDARDSIYQFYEDDMIREPENQQTREWVISRLNLKKHGSETPRTPIRCYDVRNDGYYCLGFDTFDGGIVNVYDADFNYIYGYSFNTNRAFSVKWNDCTLEIIFLEGSRCVGIEDSSVKYVCRISNNKESKYFQHTFSQSFVLKKNGYIYRLDAKHSLTREDQTGEIEVIYDASNTFVVRKIVLICGFTILSILAAIIIKQSLRKAH